jgi:hypothetical protein
MFGFCRIDEFFRCVRLWYYSIPISNCLFNNAMFSQSQHETVGIGYLKKGQCRQLCYTSLQLTIIISRFTVNAL